MRPIAQQHGSLGGLGQIAVHTIVRTTVEYCDFQGAYFWKGEF